MSNKKTRYSCFGKPTTLQVRFGIKVDVETGTMVAKVGSEAAITVTMIWDEKKRIKQ